MDAAAAAVVVVVLAPQRRGSRSPTRPPALLTAAVCALPIQIARRPPMAAGKLAPAAASSPSPLWQANLTLASSHATGLSCSPGGFALSSQSACLAATKEALRQQLALRQIRNAWRPLAGLNLAFEPSMSLLAGSSLNEIAPQCSAPELRCKSAYRRS